jgi:hypothetical protein
MAARFSRVSAALRAVGLFEVFEIRNVSLREWVDTH